MPTVAHSVFPLHTSPLHRLKCFCCFHFADEKEKYDPQGFRDSVLQGLDKAGSDLEAVSKFLDTAGSKLDYRRYGEALFDILIAGGLLGMYLLLFPSVCVHTCAGCSILVQFCYL